MTKFRNAAPETLHRLLGPRTAYLVGSLNQDGSGHLCAASNVTNVGNSPQLVALALWPAWTTTGNIQHQGDFTLNLMDARYINSLWIAGHRYSKVYLPKGSDKFVAAGLHPSPSEGVGAYGVEEALAILECRVMRVIDDFSDHVIFLARVVAGHCCGDYFDSTDVIDTTLAHAAMQNSGNRFAQTWAAATPDTGWCSEISRMNLSS